MPLRVITFLLVFALFWSGFGTTQPTGSVVQNGQQHSHALADLADLAMAQDGETQPVVGEREHSPLHELLSQAQADPLTEGAGLLPAPLATQPAALLLSAPHRFEATAFRGPCLDGLLRPPCATGLPG